MTAADTAGVLEVVRMLWPHSNLGGEPQRVLALWTAMLADFTPTEVEAAVRELAIGREHAPPVGVVVAKCAERASGLPPWDLVWPELEAKSRECVTVRGYRIPAVDEFSDGRVGEFARLHWRSLCPLPKELGTLRAQMRDAYLGTSTRAVRDRALEAVGAPRRLDVSSALRLAPGA